jgi:hypothetical protein
MPSPELQTAGTGSGEDEGHGQGGWHYGKGDLIGGAIDPLGSSLVYT